jgi:glycosyltransferase involved in cell wall biosynthesis
MRLAELILIDDAAVDGSPTIVDALEANQSSVNKALSD